MKTLYCFIKTFKENIRDWKILILVLIFAPFFVYLMYLYMGDSGSLVYNVIVNNNDNEGIISKELISEWGKLKAEDGKSILRIKLVSDTAIAKRMIKNKDADLLITIPDDLSESFNTFLIDGNSFLSPLISYGDQANVKYMIGSMSLLFLVGALACFSVISISIITACFIKTMFGLLTLGCFPFFILMFFSDCFMPLPKVNLFNLAGNQVYLNDVLPTATATRAFNKILNYDSGFSDVSFELIWILTLSLVYFFFGIWLFRRKYKY